MEAATPTAPAPAGIPQASRLGNAKGQPYLMFSTTANYAWIYNDSGSGAHMDGAIWRPLPAASGWFIVGDLAWPNYDQPAATSPIVMAVNDDPANPLLAAPVGYQQVWNDHGSGGHNDGSVWWPVPPDGYVAMGSVGQPGYDMPAIDAYRCVRADLVQPGPAGGLIWCDAGSGAHLDVSLYAGAAPGLFVAQPNYDPYAGPCYAFKG